MGAAPRRGGRSRHCVRERGTHTGGAARTQRAGPHSTSGTTGTRIQWLSTGASSRPPPRSVFRTEGHARCARYARGTGGTARREEVGGARRISRKTWGRPSGSLSSRDPPRTSLSFSSLRGPFFPFPRGPSDARAPCRSKSKVARSALDEKARLIRIAIGGSSLPPSFREIPSK